MKTELRKALSILTEGDIGFFLRGGGEQYFFRIPKGSPTLILNDGLPRYLWDRYV